jgi:5-formyltetrahydrofolate cyclo-ligase
MVGPSPPFPRCEVSVLDEKQRLRDGLRRERRSHVAALPAQIRALVFLRPPGLIADAVGDGAVVGLYHALADEAPTRGYAKWFSENGRQIALPWFAERGAPMRFRLWRDPYGDDALEAGPYGALQPGAEAEDVMPDVVFTPLVGFTAEGDRLGHGGGHYDRWLATHPGVPAVGLGWDCQLLKALPRESHDIALDAVITPTRLYQRPEKDTA